MLPPCDPLLKYKQAARKKVVIRSRKPKTIVSTRIRVRTYNKTSPPNVLLDLPYGIDFVSAKGPSAKTADIQIDALANVIYILASPSQKSKRVVSYKIKVSLGVRKLDALSQQLPFPRAGRRRSPIPLTSCHLAFPSR